MALSSSLLLFSFLLVIPLAITVHKIIYSGWVPPNDYGSGEMFNAIADRYDFINRVMSLGMDISWRERMVQTVHASIKEYDTSSTSSPRILDVSTGTADVALLLAKEMPRASILGIDPSNKMLDFGREKIHQQNLDAQIVLQQHDARDLRGLEENSFDATMAFGIRNVPEKDQALCEIHRLLKDTSRFCILEFAEPDESAGIWGAMARVFIRHVVPFLGGILSGQSKEYLHLQNSIKDFPIPAEFVDFIKSVQCPTGSYQVDELIQMNGDSVQLYVCTAVRNQQPPDELDVEEEHEVAVDETETEPNISEEQIDTVDEEEEEPATAEIVEEKATEDAAAEQSDEATVDASEETQEQRQHEEVDQEPAEKEPEATVA